MQCAKAQVHNTNFGHTWLKSPVGKIKQCQFYLTNQTYLIHPLWF